MDIFHSSERALKYGILFIVLTFTAFFLIEVMQNLKIHPIQYLLVGFALTLFYLLLFSLSEHLGLGTAYLIAASACVGLLGVYLKAMLKQSSHAIGFSAGLATLYGILYGLLQSEEAHARCGFRTFFSALYLL